MIKSLKQTFCFFCFLLSSYLSFLLLHLLFVPISKRILLLQGVVPPSLTLLTANWFPKLERGFFFTIIQSGAALGSCLGSLFAGFLCDSAGRWPSSFYAFGKIFIFCVYGNLPSCEQKYDTTSKDRTAKSTSKHCRQKHL